MNRHTLKYVTLFVLMFNLVACSRTIASSTSCTADGNTQLLSNEDDGFCVVYPHDYCLMTSDAPRQTTIVGGNTVREDISRCENEPLLLHSDVVWVSINVEPADGRSLSQIIGQYEANLGMSLADFGIEQSEVTLGGETAVQLDKTPGQDSQRIVYALYGDNLFTLTFVPATSDYGDRYTEMLDFYATITDSFQFLD